MKLNNFKILQLIPIFFFLSGCASSQSLYVASYMGDSSKVEALLDKGKNVNSTGKGLVEKGRIYGIKAKPLTFAIAGGHLDIVKMLVENGADIHSIQRIQPEVNVGLIKGTPLILAAMEKESEISEYLIKKGADVNTMLKDRTWHVSMRNWKGASPLTFTANYGDKDLVKLLLKYGADVDHVTHDDKTPLYFAALNGYPEVARILIENGADVNYSNGIALLEAAYQGNIETAFVLLDNNAGIYPDKYDPGYAAFIMHVAADYYSSEDPEKAILLYKEASEYYEKGSAEFLKSANKEKVVRTIMNLALNLASEWAARESAVNSGKKILTMRSLQNGGTPQSMKVYYSYPINLIGRKGVDKFENLAERSNVGKAYCDKIINCYNSGENELVECVKKVQD